MKSEDESLELIRRYIDGDASDADREALQEQLRNDPNVRRLHARYANIDATLGRGCIGHREPSKPTKQVRTRWLSWRPLVAAAAGLVIGAFSATAVWAVSFTKNAQKRFVHLENSGFESPAPWTPLIVPSIVRQWAADPCEVVENRGLVYPHEGSRMLQFLAASNTGDFEGSKNMASDLWQVVELPGNGRRTVKVRAWFNAETSEQARFHIAAVAGDGDAAMAPHMWENRHHEGSSLAFARAMTLVDHDPATWEPGELTLQVPAGARVLVISIAAYRLPVEPAAEWFPGQFVDDVSVSVTEEVLP